MMLRNNTLYLQNRIDRLVFWYSLLMAFPAIVVFQNISIFIFPFLLLAMRDLSGKFFEIRNFVQFIVILFALGALISTFNIPVDLRGENFARAIQVLPNYLYWAVMILFMTTHMHRIRLGFVFKGIFAGLILSIFYYFVLQRIGISNFIIFKTLTQNAFAFLIICYTPILVWYAWRQYGTGVALLALFILVICGFLSGSRSGSILVLSGGLLTLILNRRSVSNVLLIGTLGYVIVISLINTELIKEIIRELNPRTYNIVYLREETLDSDRSLLTRLAQIEKATLIYEKYPWSGIGLNNFTSYKVKLPGNFAGAEMVVSKRDIDEKSAHNSYFGFLAEGGLFLLVPFVSLLLYCNVYFFRNIRSMKLEYKPIFIGILHMSIHLYFIYAILNVFAWFLIGLGCLVIVRSKQ